MSMTPVLNPVVPCTLDLNGMFVGKSICVYGTVHPNANRFEVNLLCKRSDDIALHINPRFDEQQVVMNTNTNGWGVEEREEKNFPFRKGQAFGIKIVCKENEFEIFCNRYRLFATYSHRVPYSSIDQVSVAADCNVTIACSRIEGLEIPAQVFKTPGNHLKIDIPFLNIRGHSFVVVGKPTNNNGRFEINFGEGEKIHFHFNPRMDEDKVVCNSFENGKWGEEVRLEDTFPFKYDAPFQVKISVEKKTFHVSINGMFAVNFRKRIRQLKQIRVITVAGDVEIKEAVLY